MDNLITEILNGIKLLKIIRPFEYKILEVSKDYLLLKIVYDNEIYRLKVKKI